MIFKKNNNTEIRLGRAHGPSIQASALPTPGGAVYLRSPQLTSLAFTAQKPKEPKSKEQKNWAQGRESSYLIHENVLVHLKLGQCKKKKKEKKTSAKILFHLSDRQTLQTRPHSTQEWLNLSDGLAAPIRSWICSVLLIQNMSKNLPDRGAWKFEKGHRNKVNFFFLTLSWSRQEPQYYYISLPLPARVIDILHHTTIAVDTWSGISVHSLPWNHNHY